ncbi:TetR/AcrR family transcriptional regulator [Arthrobacter sp. P2b]|uniref:TetR/AcrR family transcriptional regulator n=1 Tax=Arthrobacter sp. P2b TaxID=1938741 RepID=UPI0009C8F07B|nr:TetR/AcrR family transcriptional regulator [Arthrobacter sp. P2b]SLK10566.1 transcriptional regulator, TetR family [Arthrobacter sp. P2b]
MTTQQTVGSNWRGKTAGERQAARRVLLLEAALNLLGANGVSSLGVRAICREAGLTERYFYESFKSLDELVGETYDAVIDGAYQAMQAAMVEAGSGYQAAEAAIRSFTDYLTSDPRRARVFLMETEVAGTLASQLRRKLDRNRGLFISLLKGLSDEPIDALGLELNARALMGSQTRLFLAWISGSLDISRERFIQHTLEVFKAVAAVRS